VGLNSDSSARGLKGPGRPIVPAAERAELLLSLRSIDYVIIFDSPTPGALIAAILPDVLVKGADWAKNEIVGGDIVTAAGGRVVRVRLAKGRSTTNIVKRILARLG
jgi:D-beta-D-heptose 7-phosphate kinase/D-beta-D-heptose 1-phosphate adenosyltransferase